MYSPDSNVASVMCISVMSNLLTGTALPCFTHCIKTNSKTKNGWGFINPANGGLARVKNMFNII